MTVAERTRAHIVEAADDLFYRQGFGQTSFAHVAEVVGISRGNFYYHFRTKDEILDAVVDRRLERTRAMLEQWESEGLSPPERLKLFIRILIRNQDKIMQYGCPVGTLCAELAKLSHDALPDSARLFTLFRGWLRQQFEQMGDPAQADDRALYLLAMSQGVAALATALKDDAFVAREVARMCDWIDQQGE